MSTTATPTGFAQRIETLPPLPAIVPAVIEATSNTGVSADLIADVLRRDPTVAAKVLRIANSPFYSRNGDITDVGRAVVRLGVMAVRNLVIGLCAGSALRAIGRARQGHALLWYHSVATAAAAELIAREVGYGLPEEAFTAGLLHDFGQLAMLVTEPTLFEQVATQSSPGDKKFLFREREAFGMDHTEAGAAIMRHWGLPIALCEAARDHHAVTAAEFAASRLTAIVALADTLTQRMGIGLDFTTGTSPRTQAALEALSLSSDDAFRIAQVLPARIAETQQMLEQANRVGHWADEATGPVARWVTDDGRDPDTMSRLLLESRGYTVDACRADALDEQAINSLQIFADEVGRASHLPGIELVPELRQREETHDTDRCRIPEQFSVFDLLWAEEYLS
ncbi:MAG: HDOD domain-containing protein [Planctomycetota bacterium]